MNGIIKRMMPEKGFGFIQPNDGSKDLFFHFSGVVGKVDTYNTLQENMEVTFEVQDGQKGPMAVEVQPV